LALAKSRVVDNQQGDASHHSDNQHHFFHPNIHIGQTLVEFRTSQTVHVCVAAD